MTGTGSPSSRSKPTNPGGRFQTVFRSLSSGPALLALLLVGCASAPPRPGTGDLSFTLRWDGTADLDLHVEDPLGRRTSALSAYSPPEEDVLPADLKDGELLVSSETSQSGILDIDCNAAPDRLCERPLENVFWPSGTAPLGDYELWVLLFQRLRDGSSVPFVIEVRRGERVVHTFSGKLDDERRESKRFVYAFQ